MPKCHCGKYALFNNIGEKKGLFCVKHKEPQMIDIAHKACEADGCLIRPTYNIFGETKGRFCNLHKEPQMIDVICKTCEIDGCLIRPTFNNFGETKGRFCKKHKEIQMVNVTDKVCEIKDCKKQPSYNIIGETRGRFCSDHKEPQMVDVKHKTCEAIGCLIKPTFNNFEESKARFCVDHKEPQMINVICKTCEIDGCNKQPSYNILGETRGRFCSIHKLHNMIDIINKKCEIDGCLIRPSYNIIGESEARFCVDHKEQTMIDVKNKHCIISGCITRSYYGFLGKPPTHCALHKQQRMIPSPTKLCQSCKQLGTHELNGIRFCEEHKPADAENLGIATCTSCGLDDILTNGKCNTCDPTIQKIRQHAKENRVKDILTVAGFTFVHDKMLEGPQCGRERPDFQIDCGSHFVYVEVDEHQHCSYACECEQTRMINVVHARGMPVRWIRYNPDCYEPIKGQRYVKQEQREKKLIEYVNYAMKHSPQEDKAISNVLYLFYDEYDTTHQPWHTLL